MTNWNWRTIPTTNWTWRPSLIKIAIPIIYTWFWDDIEVWDDNKYWLDGWWETTGTNWTWRPKIT